MGEISKNKQIQFYASLLVLLAGIVLVFISLFLQPVGIIHYTVLSAFGMFLTFVGAVWQLDVKYTFKTEELRSEYERHYRPHPRHSNREIINEDTEYEEEVEE